MGSVAHPLGLFTLQLWVSVRNNHSTLGSSFKAAEIVSNLWAEDCLDQGREIRPVEGWHRPVSVDRGARPCEGAVIGVTNYVGREREFITFLERNSTEY